MLPFWQHLLFSKQNHQEHNPCASRELKKMNWKKLHWAQLPTFSFAQPIFLSHLQLSMVWFRKKTKMLPFWQHLLFSKQNHQEHNPCASRELKK